LESRDRRRDEIKSLKKCSHQNIVKYFEDFFEDGDQRIVMEYCPGGDLADLITNQKNTGELFDSDLILSYAHNLASGMQYMKSLRILHRDLKEFFENASIEQSMRIGLSSFT